MTSSFNQPLHRALIECDVIKLYNLAKSFALDIHSVLKAMYVLIDQSRSKRLVSPLQAAVFIDDYELCKQLLTENAEFYSLTYFLLHPLNAALDLKYYKIAKLLIDSGASVCIKQYNFYPMYFAIRYDSPEYIIDCIIEAGFSPSADINVDTNMKPLHKAVQVNNVNVARLLLSKYKVRCNKRDLRGWAPMHYAVKYKFLDMIKLLGEFKPNLELESGEGLAPLFYAILNEDIESLEILLALGADIHHFSSKYMYPLNLAVSLCNVKMVEMLITKGVDVNKVTPGTQNSALHSAAISQRSKHHQNSTQTQGCLREIVCLLINNGSKIDAQNKMGYTPLQLAIKEENFEVVQDLVEMEAIINCKLDTATNFHFVCKFGNEKLVQTYLERGADCYARDENNLTPYHFAFLHQDFLLPLFWKFNCPFDLVVNDNYRKPICKTDLTPEMENQKIFLDGIKANKPEVIHSSLAKGAEVRGCSMDLPFPLHFAAKNGLDAVVHVLLDNSVQANYVDNEGKTPLHLVASKGHYNICLNLLQFGASYNIPSKITGQTPLDLAKQNNHGDIAVLLTNIDNMFKSRKEKVIIKKLKNMTETEVLFSTINCVDKKGDTLMANALRKKFYLLAEAVLKYRFENLKDSSYDQ